MTSSYNHTPHRSINKRPVNVNKSNQVEIWNNLYGSVGKSKIKKETPPKTRRIPYIFKIGDKVRISNYKNTFDKGSFSHNWTTEIFTITKRYIKQGQVIYEIEDYAGDDVIGRFYHNELQKVKEKANKRYNIEKVLDKRKNIKGETELLVKFKGWPKKYNSWVKDIKNLKQ